MELRAQVNEALGKANPPVKLSLNDFVLKAAAEAVRRVPAVNASFEGDSVRQFADVQLSFAVAIAEGLITPVIREAQNKSLVQISGEAKVLAVKAKDGKLKPEEFQGGTFTVSNLGMLGIDRFSAIINPPQAAILAVGNIVKKPVVGPGDNHRGRPAAKLHPFLRSSRGGRRHRRGLPQRIARVDREAGAAAALITATGDESRQRGGAK